MQCCIMQAAVEMVRASGCTNSEEIPHDTRAVAVMANCFSGDSLDSALLVGIGVPRNSL